MPRGRIVEVFGPESSGKTTLIYHVLAEAQKLGGVCAFIDAEHAMDPLYAREIGVDIDELLVSQPDYGEQALEIADMLVRSGAVDVVAIDSVAALTPRAELEGQMGDQTVGLQARMMSQAMRKLAGNLNRTQTLCIFTNQIREKVGVMFGSPETQPGGRALKFYSSQRLDIRRIETLKEGTEAVGNRVRVKVVKNKVAAPFRQAEFDIEFGKGISTSGCLIDLGIEHNVVTKSGSFFSYGDERLGQGRNNAKAYLDEHLEVAKEIEAQDLRGAGHRPRPRRSRSTPTPTVPGDRCRSADGDARARADRTGGVTDPERLQHALDLAYRYLGHRDRTVAEVRGTSSAEGIEPEVVDDAARRAARTWATSTTRATPSASPRTAARSTRWGAERIERRLLAVGVDAGAHRRRARRAGAGEELEAALAVLRRRFARRRSTTATATARWDARPQGLRARAGLRRGAGVRARRGLSGGSDRRRAATRRGRPRPASGLRRPSRGTTIQAANDQPARATKDQQISVFPFNGSFSFDAIDMRASPGRTRPSTPATTEHRQRT